MQGTRRSTAIRGTGWFFGFALAVGVGFTVAILIFVASHCYFFGDDYLGFLVAKTAPFPRALLAVVGSQVAPLHRLINLAVYRLWPMNFAAALAVLLAFHVLGVLYLFRILQLFGRSPVNLLLLSWYSAYAYLWFTFAWWSSGLQRVPYVAFGVMSIYYYARYSRERRPTELALFCACFVAALGFYAKAVLLPLCFVLTDLQHAEKPRALSLFNRFNLFKWAISAALLLLALAYVPLSRSLVGASFDSNFGVLDWRFQLKVVTLGFTVLSHSVFGMVIPYGGYSPTLLVYGVWAAFIGYTSYRAPKCALFWSFGALIIALNFLLIGLSVRTRLFGLQMADEPRYFYELAFLVVLIVGLVLHELPLDTPEMRWLLSSWRRPVGAALVIAGLLAHAVVSYKSSVHTFFTKADDIFKTKSYMANLRKELAEFSDTATPPLFADTPIPPYVSGLDFTFRFHSQLFDLFGMNARFVPREQAVVEVNEHGHVIAVRR